MRWRRTPVAQAPAKEQAEPPVGAVLHPKPGASADEVIWAADTSTLGRGIVAAAPGPLAPWLRSGLIAQMRVDDGGVAIALGPGASWSDVGAKIRTALIDALDSPEQWVFGQSNAVVDATIAEAADEVLAGDFGQYVRSHGGSFSVRGVHDGVVDVRVDGSCRACSLAAMSLKVGFEKRLRDVCPAVVEVRRAV
jgi:Fe-S cluster biogenesis protein NfuA